MHEFQIDLIGYYILIGDQEKAIELADKTLVDKLRNKNRNDVLGDLKYGYGNIMQQFKNVGKLKATSDKQDKFHIYKMNCSTLNGEPSYVFKTFHEAVELVLKMDSDIPQGKDSAMNEEDAYMDGMYSQVKGFKSLSLWTYYPGMKRIMHLATMESEREDTICYIVLELI